LKLSPKALETASEALQNQSSLDFSTFMMKVQRIEHIEVEEKLRKLEEKITEEQGKRMRMEEKRIELEQKRIEEQKLIELEQKRIEEREKLIKIEEKLRKETFGQKFLILSQLWRPSLKFLLFYLFFPLLLSPPRYFEESLT